MTLSIKDLGLGKIKADLEALSKSKVTIGWQGLSGSVKHPEARMSVASVGRIMEHGTRDGHVPARPSLRTTFHFHQREIDQVTQRALAGVADGRMNLEQAESMLGQSALDFFRQTMSDARSWAEPLADSTKRAKGHDQPLVDSFTLYDKASWAVRRNDSIVRQGGENE